MGPTWALSAPDGSHVGPMNLVIRGALSLQQRNAKHQNHSNSFCFCNDIRYPHEYQFHDNDMHAISIRRTFCDKRFNLGQAVRLFLLCTKCISIEYKESVQRVTYEAKWSDIFLFTKYLLNPMTHPILSLSFESSIYFYDWIHSEGEWKRTMPRIFSYRMHYKTE